MTCPPSHGTHGFSQTWNPTGILSKASLSFCGGELTKMKGRSGGISRAWQASARPGGKEGGKQLLSLVLGPPCLSSLGAQPEFLLPVLRASPSTANRNAARLAQKPGQRNGENQPGETEIHESLILSLGKCTFAFNWGVELVAIYFLTF